jgi:hypothetical protein
MLPPAGTPSSLRRAISPPPPPPPPSPTAGLCGLAATRWCDRVVVTDYEPEVLALLRRNAEKHADPGCGGVHVECLSWGDEADHRRIAALFRTAGEGDGGASASTNTVPLVVGADVVYWAVSIKPLVATVTALMAKPHGQWVLGYVDRVSRNRAALLTAAEEAGLAVEVIPPESFLPTPPPAHLAPHLRDMTLYRFTWR